MVELGPAFLALFQPRRHNRLALEISRAVRKVALWLPPLCSPINRKVLCIAGMSGDKNKNPDQGLSRHSTMPRSDRLVSPLIVSRVPTMQVASQNQNPSRRSPPNTFVVRQPSQRNQFEPLA
ncbi:hypothetical protein CISG_01950 [Coccidioides immitis RMSCC 3703]|uniref:Uncharacterized protein n=2 Tax=Coccidioides immitis TaxID=5501 RepID=A0A0J8R462_COCIT|nr:hypothetical protein CIRG_07870 [Coccidioides immitis RMSCC 2394]KMU79531.1 hypothetical protein CISG_01950 [Coccidioides immitis RMSCC 3703]